jgi:hypothetical protein
MKISAVWIPIILLFNTAVRAQPSSAPTINCAYGVLARYDEGILKYDDFTVQLRKRTEHLQANGKMPWVVYVFEVLDREGRTIGGDITFNSEERANGRRFDVDGKIYLAEMFYSTAGLPESGSVSPQCHSRLASGEIVIWNETAAAKQNRRLQSIWQNEKVDPGARYSSLNAYADGALIPGFSSPSGKLDDGRSRLAADSLKVEKVSLAGDDESVPTTGAVECNYGSRVSCREGVLKYPDFSLRLVECEERNAFDIHQSAVAYRFLLYDHAGNRIHEGFEFDTYGFSNGRRFEVGGKGFFAEMFATTAPSREHEVQSHGICIPLREGELIVWDEPTATAANGRILPAWSEKNVQPEWRRSRVFAAGAPLEGAFTGTYMWGANDWCEYSKLDAPPTVLRRINVIYPQVLSGSGFVGHVHGILFVNQDGSVDRAITNGGNERLFQTPSQAALAQWRFSPPMKNSRPVKAVLSFDWDICEPIPDVPQIKFR